MLLSYHNNYGGVNMKFCAEIENIKEYDVIVAGSGPAGIVAAILSGRNGERTLLVESGGRVGGVSTAGMMSHFTITISTFISTKYILDFMLFFLIFI